jgi:hypothetical protein
MLKVIRKEAFILHSLADATEVYLVNMSARRNSRMALAAGGE